jgi:hypothetical protein
VNFGPPSSLIDIPDAAIYAEKFKKITPAPRRRHAESSDAEHSRKVLVSKISGHAAPKHWFHAAASHPQFRIVISADEASWIFFIEVLIDV